MKIAVHKPTMLRQRQPRAAFTLVEILIVVTIIGILAGLTLPAINGALKKARLAETIQDMVAIGHALEKFKAKYGIYPPSRIRLRENSTYSMQDAFDQHSIRYLRRIWPNIQLQIVTGASGGLPAGATPFIWFLEYNAAFAGTEGGGNSRTYELEGDECLVFFLGGIAESKSAANAATGPFVLHGFSTRATDPSGVPLPTLPQTLQREGPYFEFDASRLFRRDNTQWPGTVMTAAIAGAATTDFATAVAPNANPKMLSYRLKNSVSEDPRPIAYFSADEGTGYRPNDMNIHLNPATPPTMTPVEPVSPGTFQVMWPPNPTPPPVLSNYVSAAPNPYTETFPYPPATTGWNGTPRTAQQTAVRYCNPLTYQLIAPGLDNQYGPGGQIPRQPSDALVNGKGDLIMSGVSYDNITNISGSQTLGDFNKFRLSSN